MEAATADDGTVIQLWYWTGWKAPAVHWTDGSADWEWKTTHLCETSKITPTSGAGRWMYVELPNIRTLEFVMQGTSESGKLEYDNPPSWRRRRNYAVRSIPGRTTSWALRDGDLTLLHPDLASAIPLTTSKDGSEEAPDIPPAGTNESLDASSNDTVDIVGPDLAKPPPKVTIFHKDKFVWVGYSFIASRGIIGYEVLAGTKLDDMGNIISQGGPHRWKINGGPQRDSAFSCGTGIATSDPGTAYGQVRVQYHDGIWSRWSGRVKCTLSPKSVRRKPARLDSPLAAGLCRLVSPRTGEWVDYNPDPRHIAVIGHGFNGTVDRLERLGYEVTVIYSQTYDRYPSEWRSSNQSLLFDRLDRHVVTPAISSADDQKDLITVADDVVFPTILECVRSGSGPAAVVTGSRGGQLTICRLWKMWQGPSVVLSAGCRFRTPPSGVSLGLLCGGKDFFHTREPRRVHSIFKTWPGYLAHYHHPNDDHSFELTYNNAIGPLLKAVITESTENAAFGEEAASGKYWVKQRGVGQDFVDYTSVCCAPLAQ